MLKSGTKRAVKTRGPGTRVGRARGAALEVVTIPSQRVEEAPRAEVARHRPLHCDDAVVDQGAVELGEDVAPALLLEGRDPAAPTASSAAEDALQAQLLLPLSAPHFEA